jgi:hypothetical protein
MMNEVAYCSGRAEHYLTLASSAGDRKLKDAYEAVAMEFSVRAMVGNPSRQLRFVDGVAPEL